MPKRWFRHWELLAWKKRDDPSWFHTAGISFRDTRVRNCIPSPRGRWDVFAPGSLAAAPRGVHYFSSTEPTPAAHLGKDILQWEINSLTHQKHPQKHHACLSEHFSTGLALPGAEYFAKCEDLISVIIDFLLVFLKLYFSIPLVGDTLTLYPGFMGFGAPIAAQSIFKLHLHGTMHY